MASGADDSRVPGSGDSDQAVEANGASRWADWTLNRVLVVAGLVFAVLAPPILRPPPPSFVGARPPPLLPGGVAGPRALSGPRPAVSLLSAGAAPKCRSRLRHSPGRKRLCARVEFPLHSDHVQCHDGSRHPDHDPERR